MLLTKQANFLKAKDSAFNKFQFQSQKVENNGQQEHGRSILSSLENKN